MIKITSEQVAQLPELLKTKTQREVAEMFQVKPQNITYWVRQYEKRGVVLPHLKKKGLLDKILQNDTNLSAKAEE